LRRRLPQSNRCDRRPVDGLLYCFRDASLQSGRGALDLDLLPGSHGLQAARALCSSRSCRSRPNIKLQYPAELSVTRVANQSASEDPRRLRQHDGSARQPRRGSADRNGVGRERVPLVRADAVITGDIVCVVDVHHDVRVCGPAEVIIDQIALRQLPHAPPVDVGIGLGAARLAGGRNVTCGLPIFLPQDPPNVLPPDGRGDNRPLHTDGVALMPDAKLVTDVRGVPQLKSSPAGNAATARK
jgi:hypothetical protein